MVPSVPILRESFRGTEALVLHGRSHALEHGALRGLVWEDDVVLPVDHEDGRQDPGDEVEGVDFGKESRLCKAPDVQHGGLEPRLDSQDLGCGPSAEAEAIVGHLLGVDVRT